MNLIIDLEDELEDDWVRIHCIVLKEHPLLAAADCNDTDRNALQNYACIYDLDIDLLDNQRMRISASYESVGHAGWIMISENGKHKTSTTGIKSSPRLLEPCLKYTTAQGITVRLALQA